jgi:hypothetical protein
MIVDVVGSATADRLSGSPGEARHAMFDAILSGFSADSVDPRQSFKKCANSDFDIVGIAFQTTPDELERRLS